MKEKKMTDDNTSVTVADAGEWLSEDVPNPPTANYTTKSAAVLLRGLIGGNISPSMASAGSQLVGAIARVHANKLRAATYQGKPLHKTLLKELSVTI